jgi:hypothetical protein
VVVRQYENNIPGLPAGLFQKLQRMAGLADSTILPKHRQTAD